ncbi:DUF1573 domain-containing protein [Thermogemmata fonticola]|uniref:DUF1573 domain-containing protein n=1 Tax=Thermogemmata fonticola TaxID=2755323 RepID=A0A7V8VBE9_9BACT|nr:DUF1573 domain-containing protein [Thermogemmata fonticola]MBA2224725.1 DUF1573 domain-containing protein [Thermogemmata fonticola]
MLRLLSSIVVTVGVITPVWAGGAADLFSERVKDFGASPRGVLLVHYFRFTNTTGQPLVLGTPRVSCGCVSVALSNQRVGPGETAAVIAYMDTRKIPTPNTIKSVTIYVPFLSPTVEEVTLRVQTIARDDLSITPDTIDFGTLPSGQGGRRTATITFQGDANWQITSVASTGGYVQAELSPPQRQGHRVSYTLTTILSKDCPPGNWICELILRTNHPGTPHLRLPVTVVVTPPVVVARPQTVTFERLSVGQTAEQRLTLEADRPFRILRVRGADEQVQVTLDADRQSQSHAISITVRPQGPQPLHRTLEFHTDNPKQPIIPVIVRAPNIAP